MLCTLNGRDNKALERLVDQLRKLPDARSNQEESDYISTEINRPVVFYNFDINNPSRLQYKAFKTDEFDEFITEVQTRYNSTIEDYVDDLHNIETIIGDNFEVGKRLNAARRYVNYYFLPIDAHYYRIPGYIEEVDNSIIQNLILAITNKYCLDVPAESDQYKVKVLLRADQFNEINMDNRIPINECNNDIELY